MKQSGRKLTWLQIHSDPSGLRRLFRPKKIENFRKVINSSADTRLSLFVQGIVMYWNLSIRREKKRIFAWIALQIIQKFLLTTHCMIKFLKRLETPPEDTRLASYFYSSVSIWV